MLIGISNNQCIANQYQRTKMYHSAIAAPATRAKQTMTLSICRAGVVIRIATCPACNPCAPVSSVSDCRCTIGHSHLKLTQQYCTELATASGSLAMKRHDPTRPAALPEQHAPVHLAIVRAPVVQKPTGSATISRSADPGISMLKWSVSKPSSGGSIFTRSSRSARRRSDPLGSRK